MRQVSYDLSLAGRSSWPTAARMTALEMQWEHLDLARKYAEDRGLDAVGGARSARRSCGAGKQVLTGLESDPMSLATQLDWVAKYRVINGLPGAPRAVMAGPQAGGHGPAVPRRAARSDRLHARVGHGAAARPDEIVDGP